MDVKVSVKLFFPCRRADSFLKLFRILTGETFLIKPDPDSQYFLFRRKYGKLLGLVFKLYIEKCCRHSSLVGIWHCQILKQLKTRNFMALCPTSILFFRYGRSDLGEKSEESIRRPKAQGLIVLSDLKRGPVKSSDHPSGGGGVGGLIITKYGWGHCMGSTSFTLA
jgi:hypothetical protein